MRSRAPLLLMELTVMLLILAIASGLCLQGFAWADKTSIENARTDRALLQIESAAQVLQACGGDMEEAVGLYGGTLEDGTWVLPMDDGTYVKATPEQTDVPGLGAARLVAEYGSSQLLQLQVCWQEVGYEE